MVKAVTLEYGADGLFSTPGYDAAKLDVEPLHLPVTFALPRGWNTAAVTKDTHNGRKSE